MDSNRAMSAGCPYRCTGMIAAVRGVIAASVAAGSIVRRSGSMSANTGLAPVITMASALKAADNGAVMTSSPGPMPSARSVSASASVPVPTPTACGDPDEAANSASNASSSGPRMNQPRVMTRSIAARTSGASAPGTSDMNGTRVGVIWQERRPAPRTDRSARDSRQACWRIHDEDPPSASSRSFSGTSSSPSKRIRCRSGACRPAIRRT